MRESLACRLRRDCHHDVHWGCRLKSWNTHFPSLFGRSSVQPVLQLFPLRCFEGWTVGFCHGLFLSCFDNTVYFSFLVSFGIPHMPKPKPGQIERKLQVSISWMSTREKSVGPRSGHERLVDVVEGARGSSRSWRWSHSMIICNAIVSIECVRWKEITDHALSYCPLIIVGRGCGVYHIWLGRVDLKSRLSSMATSSLGWDCYSSIGLANLLCIEPFLILTLALLV